jgi:hypothetical protein
MNSILARHDYMSSVILDYFLDVVRGLVYDAGMAEFPKTRAMRKYMAEIGRNGGIARAKRLTPKQRSDIARIAGKAPKREKPVDANG